MADDRSYLESQVAERLAHASAEDVRTTCSLARAERLLGREYHGRFLIELLQNAADAWRMDARSEADRCRVAVLITEDPVPTLVVANEGAALSVDVVIESLGHIGASTKTEGEAIGHKGIGFKSVLELSLCPEIYSGLQVDTAALSVAFDPEWALGQIRKKSPTWEADVREVDGLDPDDDLAPIPVLRYPRWVDAPSPIVDELKADGFDTVVRLPFDDRFVGRLGLSREQALSTMRSALSGISDEMLLLLDTFKEVRLEDRTLSNPPVIVKPDPSSAVERR